MNKNRNLVLGISSAIGCEIIYGMSFVFSKQATNIASPFTLLGWRFLLAFVVMNILVGMGIIKLNFRDKKIYPLVKIALFFPVIYFIGETFGVRETTAAESGVALAGIPIAALVASTIMQGKKPTKFELSGILLTFLGVIITVLAVGSSSSFSLVGYLFLLMGVISCAIYCVLVEKAKNFSSGEITYIMLLFGAVVFSMLALGEGFLSDNIGEILTLPFNEFNFSLAIIYQGIGCSIIAFILSNLAISIIGTNRMVSFVGVATIVSIFAAFFILGEPFTILQGVGAIIIILGVYIANIKKV